MMWMSLPFEKCIQKVKTPFKLPKKEYLEQGRFPVVSQEAALISGYHDDANHLFNVDQPVVIFGDHTQVLKFIDFSFVMGADGVKILKPISDIDAKYFYYTLTTLMPKGKGYARHYKLLKELNISFPPLAEQQRIVAKLDAAFAEIDKAIDSTHSQLLEADTLYTTTLKRRFNDESVIRKRLGEICKITSSKRVMKRDYVKSGVPFFRTKEIKQLANNEPVTTELFISREMFEVLRSKFGAPTKGDVLITAIGTIGEVYVVREDDEFYFKDGNVLWLKEISDVNQEYLRYGLLSFVENLNSIAHGAAYSALPIQRLKEFELPIPSLSQQLEIVSRLEDMFGHLAVIKHSLGVKLNSLNGLKSAILAQELQPPKSEAA